VYPKADLLGDILALYQQGGQKDEGEEFLGDLPYSRPDIVELAKYWTTVVGIYLAAGEMDKAKLAALRAYQLAPIEADPGQDLPLQQLLRTLVATEGRTGLEAFLNYLKTGQGDNPLAAVPPAPITPEQQQEQEAAVGGNLSLKVDACLFNGQYPEALHAAEMQTVSDGPDAQAGIVNIARCFKAKDVCCVRANQYLDWVRTGQGANPVLTF
jgi:hypothetical protein